MVQQVNIDLEERAELILREIEQGDIRAAYNLLKEEHPSDVADVLERLDSRHLGLLFSKLEIEDAAEVLDEISTRATIELLDSIPDEKFARLLEELPVDDAANKITEIPSERADAILDLLAPEKVKEIEILLRYPERTAGRLMTTSVVKLSETFTVEQTLSLLRKVKETAETFSYLYVVDGEDRLVGLLALRDLVTSPADAKVADIMTREVISVNSRDSQEEAARIISHYDLIAVPVVGRNNHLLGIITHDDAADIVQEEFTEDAQRFGGSEPLQTEYLASPITLVFRKRIGWLLVLFVTEMLTGTVMRVYQDELQAVVALAFFIPLLIGTGGNSGSQSTSTIVRSIAVGDVRAADIWKLLWHEARTGILLGVAMGIVGLVRAMLWGTGMPMAMTVALSLFAIVVWANVIGAVLPPLAEKLHIDPAVISGPVMSTLVDATGLIIYFSVAKLVIGL